MGTNITCAMGAFLSALANINTQVSNNHVNLSGAPVVIVVFIAAFTYLLTNITEKVWTEVRLSVAVLLCVVPLIYFGYRLTAQAIALTQPIAVQSGNRITLQMQAGPHLGFYMGRPISRKTYPSCRWAEIAQSYTISLVANQDDLNLVHGSVVYLETTYTMHEGYVRLYSAESGAMYHERRSYIDEKARWMIHKTDNKTTPVLSGDMVEIRNVAYSAGIGVDEGNASWGNLLGCDAAHSDMEWRITRA